MKENDENQDIISKLPDDLLAIILSKLQVDEAVRCNILSKRLLDLWKQTPHMEFNARHMIKPFTQLLYSRESLTNRDLILHRLMQKGVSRYGSNVFLSLYSHSGDISSCRFVHFRKSLEFGEVNTWINFLVNKKNGFKNLILECVPNFGETEDHRSSKDEVRNPHFLDRIFYCLSSLELINYTIDCWSAFGDCHNLKVLKLKRIKLDDATLSGILDNCVELENFSLVESTGFERLIINKSKLQVLRLQALYVYHQLEVVAQNLSVLFIDSIRCHMGNVSIVAPNLQNFQYHWYSISRMFGVDKVSDILSYYNDLSVFENNSSTYYSGLRYPSAMFWEKQCNAIIQKIKFVHINGFKGKEQELQFAKYLITRGSMMKKITLICNGSIEEAENLLLLPRASPDLSIHLKVNESITTSS